MKKLKLKDLDLENYEILKRDELKNIRGGSDGSGGLDFSEGCPPVGTQYFYRDDDICAIWTAGWNPVGTTNGCSGTLSNIEYQPCGWA